jgi:apolipoprotein D and lipocalin family protein
VKTRLGITSVLRRYCVGIFAVMLVAGCTEEQEVLPRFEASQTFRDMDVPISSTTRYFWDDGLANWRMRYAMRPELAPLWLSFARLTESVNRRSFAISTTYEDCVPVTETKCSRESIISGVSTTNFPGRFDFAFHEGGTGQRYMRDIWVLWVDEGFRTAALGAPDGSFAWIIDRNETGGADRIKAAREVLEFNGYDVSKLKVKK